MHLPPTPDTGWPSTSNQMVPPAGPNGHIAEAKVTPAYRFRHRNGNRHRCPAGGSGPPGQSSRSECQVRVTGQSDSASMTALRSASTTVGTEI